MEPTYYVPSLYMALRIIAIACVVCAAALGSGWWRLRYAKREYWLEKRRRRGLAAVVLLLVGVPLLVFAPYEVKTERKEPLRTR